MQLIYFLPMVIIRMQLMWFVVWARKCLHFLLLEALSWRAR